MPSLTIPWTLSLIAKRARDLAGYMSTGFVNEFDCELSINWWGEYEDEYGWELDSVAIEWASPPDRFLITKDSDPEFWTIIMRGFRADELRLSERILERIHEALSDEIYSEERGRAFMEYR